MYRYILMVSGLALGGAVLIGMAETQGIAVAQEGSNAAAQCMRRPVDGAPNTTVEVLVPAAQIKGMRAKGFKVSRCGANLSSLEAHRKWRDEICTIVATSNDDVQDALEKRLGERPNVLCGMAERALGRWQRGKAGVNAHGGE